MLNKLNTGVISVPRIHIFTLVSEVTYYMKEDTKKFFIENFGWPLVAVLIVAERSRRSK